MYSKIGNVWNLKVSVLKIMRVNCVLKTTLLCCILLLLLFFVVFSDSTYLDKGDSLVMILGYMFSYTVIILYLVTPH